MGKNAACADDSTAVSLALSAGQSHDATAFPSVWEGVPKSRWLNVAVMDKAYDSDNIRRFSENLKASKPLFRQNQIGKCFTITTKRNTECVKKWSASFVESKNSDGLPLAMTNSPKPSWHSFISSALSSLFNPLENA